MVFSTSVMVLSLRSCCWGVETGGHTVRAATDEDRLAADESLGDFGATALEYAADCLAGDAHGLGRLSVAEALQVDEADRLELVDRELQMLELTGGYPGRLEEGDPGAAGDGALDGAARHRITGRESG
jgi:hypothetical protein